MRTFYISGAFYTTQEYGYTSEVEAETLEEALELHKEKLGGKYPDVEAYPVDKPFDVRGVFSVYDSEEGRDEYDEDSCILECETFEGRR